MNYFWKKLGSEYDEELVQEFRRENEVQGKTLEYATGEVKFKSLAVLYGALFVSTNVMNLAKRKNSTGIPFRYLNFPVPYVGVGGAAGVQKKLFKDNGNKEAAKLAFNNWLKQKEIE